MRCRNQMAETPLRPVAQVHRQAAIVTLPNDRRHSGTSPTRPSRLRTRSATADRRTSSRAPMAGERAATSDRRPPPHRTSADPDAGAAIRAWFARRAVSPNGPVRVGELIWAAAVSERSSPRRARRLAGTARRLNRSPKLLNAARRTREWALGEQRIDYELSSVRGDPSTSRFVSSRPSGQRSPASPESLGLRFFRAGRDSRMLRVEVEAKWMSRFSSPTS